MKTWIKMDTINIFVKDDLNTYTKEIKGELTFKDLLKELTGKYLGELHFEGQNVTQEYEDLLIQDTKFYDGCEVKVIRYNFYDLVVPDNHCLYVRFREMKNDIVSIRPILIYGNEKRVSILLQAIAMNARGWNGITRAYVTFPFQLIYQPQLKSKFFFEEMNPKECYDDFTIKADHLNKIHTQREQIHSDLFVHDHVKSGYMEIFDVCDDEHLEFFVQDTLLETGSVVAGSYPMHFLLKECKEAGDVDIFSYSLEFLRKLLNYLLENQIELKINLPSVSLRRFNFVDSYHIKIFEYKNPYRRGYLKQKRIINFVHIGKEDVHLPREENKKMSMDFILKEFDIVACTTCYDGEKIYSNKRTLKKESYFRLSQKFRLEKYRQKGFELTPISGVDPDDCDRILY